MRGDNGDFPVFVVPIENAWIRSTGLEANPSQNGLEFLVPEVSGLA